MPGTVDAAEMAFRTMIGQQISLAAAATCAAKLAAAYGEPVDLPDPALTRLFPTADGLAAVDPEELPMPRSRGRAVVGLARALSAGTVDLAAEQDGPARRKALLALPGIGPWTADYLAMRAFGDRDVLLDTDLVIKRELARRTDHRHRRVVTLPLLRDHAPLVRRGRLLASSRQPRVSAAPCRRSRVLGCERGSPWLGGVQGPRVPGGFAQLLDPARRARRRCRRRRRTSASSPPPARTPRR